MGSQSNDNAAKASLLTLPIEIQLSIYGTLLPDDLSSLVQTSRSLHHLITGHTVELSKSLLATHCPALAAAVPRPTTCLAWAHPTPLPDPLPAPCTNTDCAVLMNALLFSTARLSARTHWLARNLDFFAERTAAWRRLVASPAAYARFLLSLAPRLRSYHHCTATPHHAVCARMNLLAVSAADSLNPLHLHWALPAPFVPPASKEAAAAAARHGAELERCVATECDALDRLLARHYGVLRYRHLNALEVQSVYAEPRAACCMPWEPWMEPTFASEPLVTYARNHPPPGEVPPVGEEIKRTAWVVEE